MYTIYTPFSTLSVARDLKINGAQGAELLSYLATGGFHARVLSSAPGQAGTVSTMSSSAALCNKQFLLHLPNFTGHHDVTGVKVPGSVIRLAIVSPTENTLEMYSDTCKLFWYLHNTFLMLIKHHLQ